MFEIPQARRRTHRRSLLDTVGRHVSLRWQIYAGALFLFAAAGVILWAFVTFPAGGKGI